MITPRLAKLLRIALLYWRWKQRRTRRAVWVRSYIRRRRQFGEYHRLVSELRFDWVEFREYFRVSRDQFDASLRIIGPNITRKDTTFRESISPAQRLAICLRYLATGDSSRSLSYRFRVGWCTVSKIVPEVAKAIWEGLVHEYMPVPKEEDWRAIAKEFGERWNFPNCLGAIDGKHVVIQAPSNSGSLFYNYKGTYSIVLLAVVDANYCFRAIDVVPHTFVGDEAFPLRCNLMRPYPGHSLSQEKRIFNYRLSRARLVENAFGILAARFRMYRTLMGQHPQNVEACVKATCILHNLLRRTMGTHSATEAGEQPTPNLLDISRQGPNNATRAAMRVRETWSSAMAATSGVTSSMNPKALLRATYNNHKRGFPT
ncbi:hypothetical protein SKAU_G00157030 [Synaphobranchus kaupii]|uniref:DDE Tnp4 domain-containing protein n=1 Tax=Synaphobranchus kaupii TaxID=118154 RepID=A0A9Q1IZ07_SYNKA|nr:hypothetical protein SKAU_G00157030 [Synaphobranchus kaupii]